MGLRYAAKPFGDLPQLVVPEQLPSAVVEQHVQGDVVGVSPPFLDRAFQSSGGHTAVVSSYPYPLGDVRLLREQAHPDLGSCATVDCPSPFTFAERESHLPIPRRKLPYTEIRKVLR